MDIKLLVSLVLFFAVSGCSFYDVSGNIADSVFGLGFFSDNKNPRSPDWNGIWDLETSQCIRHEKALRRISQQLEAIEDNALREGKDFVTLPTGEQYPIEEGSPSDQSLPSPTSTCLSRITD